jgi:hypothetical protein
MPAPCEEIIDDIEDLISSQDITPKERYSSRKAVTVRKRQQKNQHPNDLILKVCNSCNKINIWQLKAVTDKKIVMF